MREAPRRIILGLYHFTTQTNQVKETNSIVDIGYHYVAVNAYGQPVDSNGDGIPDYLEDANGDGLFDVGDLADCVLAATAPGHSPMVLCCGFLNPKQCRSFPEQI